VLLALAYKFTGLRAIPLLLMVCKVGLALATFRLALAGGASAWIAAILSVVAQYVLTDLQPPAVISIIFFAIELSLLVRSRQTGNTSILFWLPPLFLLWANLHIQFVSGLVLLGLFLLALVVEHVLRGFSGRLLSDRILPLPLASVGVAAAISVLCTCASPYTVHLFPDFGTMLYSPTSFQFGAEMRAMKFRSPQEYALMLLVMAAFFALGKKHAIDMFKLILLVTATLLAFRIQRDSWYVVLAAVAIVADGFRIGKDNKESASSSYHLEFALATVLAIAIVAIASFRLPDQNVLRAKISEHWPVKACDYISANRLPAPLFSEYAWGGFLIWYLPQYPVAVDSRVDLYGNDLVEKHFKVVGGTDRLETDPSFVSAHTLLLEQHSAMADALIKLPALSSQFQLLYSDDIAAIFVRR